MKPAEIISPTPEIIIEAKKAYNRILKRCLEANEYLENKSIELTEREKHILAFRIEILDPLESYLKVLEDWGIKVNPEDTINGFTV